MEKSYLVVKPSSRYQPNKIYPSLGGGVGSVAISPSTILCAPNAEYSLMKYTVCFPSLVLSSSLVASRLKYTIRVAVALISPLVAVIVTIPSLSAVIVLPSTFAIVGLETDKTYSLPRGRVKTSGVTEGFSSER